MVIFTLVSLFRLGPLDKIKILSKNGSQNDERKKRNRDHGLENVHTEFIN